MISDLGRWRRKKVRVVMLRTICRSFSRFCSISTRRLLRNSAEENVKHLLSRRGEGLTCWSIGEFPEFLPLFSTQAPPTLTVSLSEHLRYGWFSQHGLGHHYHDHNTSTTITWSSAAFSTFAWHSTSSSSTSSSGFEVWQRFCSWGELTQQRGPILENEDWNVLPVTNTFVAICWSAWSWSGLNLWQDWRRESGNKLCNSPPSSTRSACGVLWVGFWRILFQVF